MLVSLLLIVKWYWLVVGGMTKETSGEAGGVFVFSFVFSFVLSIVFSSVLSFTHTVAPFLLPYPAGQDLQLGKLEASVYLPDLHSAQLFVSSCTA